MSPYLLAVVRIFIGANRWMSKKFDEYVLPKKFNVDGCLNFIEDIAPRHLRSGICVYDIGGGSIPQVSASEKSRFNIRYVGLDINAGELNAAPPGLYDETVVADLTKYAGRGDADLIICRSVLEHVFDNDKAFSTLSTILKDDGELILFLPSRKAWFARLNVWLPERFKMALLNFISPDTQSHHGFKAFYNKATIAEFAALGEKYGLKLVEVRPYYLSSYFVVFFPLHFVWRIAVLLKYLVNKEGAAETFYMSLQKNAQTTEL